MAIEEAKGIVAERHDLDAREAFELICHSLRSSRVTSEKGGRRKRHGGRDRLRAPVGSGFMSEMTEEVSALHEKVAQLGTALETRMAIERAKGILAERLGLTAEEAFELIRYSARSAHVTVQELCAEVQPRTATPGPILVGLVRQQRGRAAARRERDEFLRERAHEQVERAQRAEQRGRT
jgi:hypothetical protein